MRVLKPFEYSEPKTVKEAAQILYMHGERAKVLAGGTDLLIDMKRGKITPQHIVYIKDISELNKIEYSKENGLRIGALSTHQSIATSSIIKDNFGLLATACSKVGTPHIRGMGTIGGNICMAGPSQDTPPALLVLGAKLRLVSTQGERVVPIDEFFIGPFQTTISEIELLTEIQIPIPPPSSASCYQRFTKITAVDETLVGVAVLMAFSTNDDICSEIKIGLCSVAPTPFRARRAEELLRGKKIGGELVQQAARVAAEETRPRSRADYRRRMTKILVERTINEVWKKIKQT